MTPTFTVIGPMVVILWVVPMSTATRVKAIITKVITEKRDIDKCIH